MQIVFPNALRVTITATETVIEGVSGETLIAALQDAFCSMDADISIEIIVALQIVAHLLAYDGRTNDERNEMMAQGILDEMAWLADWMADGPLGLSEGTLARIEQIRASSPNYLLDEEDEEDEGL